MENNKRPKRRIKIGYILALIIVIAFGAVVLKLVLPSSGTSKYGDRLEGIENYKFSEKAQKKVRRMFLKMMQKILLMNH